MEFREDIAKGRVILNVQNGAKNPEEHSLHFFNYCPTVDMDKSVH